jgi:hypothetical protein
MFLKFAAAVSPDPSVANSDGSYPTFGTSFLDSLADGLYNVQRTGGPSGGPGAMNNAALQSLCLAKLQSVGVLLAASGIDPYIYYSLPATGASIAGAYAGGATSVPITRAAMLQNATLGTVTVYLATGTGIAGAPDVALVNAFLQATCVPLAVTLTTQAASSVALTVTCDVYAPARYAAQVTGDVQTAITNYVNATPIGGNVGLTPSNTQGIAVAALIAYVIAQVPYIQDIENMKLNSVTTDLVLTVGQCAVLSGVPTITVFST